MQIADTSVVGRTGNFSQWHQLMRKCMDEFRAAQVLPMGGQNGEQADMVQPDAGIPPDRMEKNR
ncbi:hypothetical protein [Mucilaginibacter ginsenosidivorans]|uniref:hypothetical protein n=1 Tax=Mucilaginibacter ginsenosidivorans TaxID=398053 RepID=UPI00366C9EB1